MRGFTGFGPITSGPSRSSSLCAASVQSPKVDPQQNKEDRKTMPRNGGCDNIIIRDDIHQWRFKITNGAFLHQFLVPSCRAGLRAAG